MSGLQLHSSDCLLRNVLVQSSPEIRGKLSSEQTIARAIDHNCRVFKERGSIFERDPRRPFVQTLFCLKPGTGRQSFIDCENVRVEREGRYCFQECSLLTC